jgi:hypothetical protein
MGNKILNKPADVRQDYGDTCWAAVLESFCGASLGRPRLKQADIVKQFDHLCVGGKTGKDGTMSRVGMHTMFKDVRFGLKVEEITKDYFKTTEEYLPQKLSKGLVIVGYWEKFLPGWHVSLIYGIDGRNVSYMNPDYTKGGYLKNDLNYFADKSNLVFAWRSW